MSPPIPSTPMSTPTLTIVVTCYNYERYVGRAIDSALAQTYPRIEVVVVDDGSNDGSAAVIASYGTKIRSIRQANGGSIAAYNRGYLESSGDLVVFLDADDVLDSDAGAEIVRAWDGCAVKVQYDLRIIDAANDDLGRRFCNFLPSYDARSVREDFLRKGTYRWPVTAGNAYSRTFLQQLLPLTVEHGPDGLLNTVAPVYGDVITITRPLGSYRIHGTNMWATAGTDLQRLSYRIRHRQREIENMREHAARRGIAVDPALNVLDHELAFVNYRLLALKVGLDYNDRRADSPARLWWRGLRLLATEALPLRLKLMHAMWVTAMLLSPRAVARRLILLRFNRAAVLQPVRRLMASAAARLRLS